MQYLALSSRAVNAMAKNACRMHACALALLELVRRIGTHKACVGALLTLGLACTSQAQTIIYVNDDAPPGGNGLSWATAYNDINAAFDAAQAVPLPTRNLEIWITSGVYKPTRRKDQADPRSARFTLPAKVRVVGQFVGTETSRSQISRSTPPTVFSGDLADNDVPGSTTQNRSDNIYQFFDLAEDAPTFLQTFQFLHFAGAQATGNANNSTWSRIGALFDSGVTAAGNSRAVFEDCVFRENVARYGGVWHGYPAVFRRCRFLGNRATSDGGVGYVDKDTGTTEFVNCEFHANICDSSSAEERAGILMTIGPSRIVHCTIVGTSTTGAGSVVVLFQGRVSTLELTSCVLVDNTSPSGRLFASGGGGGALTVTGSNNVLPSQATGANTTFSLTNSLGSTAAFVDRPGIDGLVGTLDDNLELVTNSPFIDTIVFAPSAELLPSDVMGRVRAFNQRGLAGPPRVDPGAHETGSPPWTPRLYVREGAVSGGVGVTWSTALGGRLGLQEALARAAAPGSGIEEIWVAVGTYRPAARISEGGSRSASFNLQNNLAIYGGFQGNEALLGQRNVAANITILSGDLNGDDNGDLNRSDNSFSVVTASQLNPTAVLDGVTIADGNASGGPSNQGGGILIVGGTGSGHLYQQGAVFRNLTVRKNLSTNPAGGSGGAVSVQGAGRAQFERATFTGNKATNFGGAIMQNASAHVSFRHCVFEANVTVDNGSSGGAMYLTSGAVAYLTDCLFVRNESRGGGGAIHVVNDAGLFADNCRFHGNKCLDGSGGALFLQNLSANPSVEVRNSTIVGNTALGSSADAAAINSGSAFSVFTNCTIVNNQSRNGSSVQVNFRGITFLNCLVYGNTSETATGEAAQTNSGSGGSRAIQYSTIQGWSGSLGGTNNNGLDPLFIRAPSHGPDGLWGTPDDDYGDLRLSSTSPAIDSGDSLVVPPDTYDIDDDGNTTEALPLDLAGQPRFYDDPTRSNTGNGNPPIDRGAYENNLATTIWNAGTGGRFDLASNWFGGVPTSTVRAIFNADVGLNRVYTVTMPTNQSAYSLSVLSNLVTINLRGLTTSGNLTLSSPGSDQNAPSLLVSGSAGVPTGLSITNTGTALRSVFASNAVVGSSVGSSGELSVSGLRAGLLLSATLDAAIAGNASVRVLNRGQLSTGSLRTSLSTGSNASIEVTGVLGLGESLLTVGGPAADEVVIASRGSSSVQLQNQGVLLGIDALDRVVFAEHAGSTANLTLTGAGSVWDTSQDDFIVGKAGVANLVVTNGATLNTATANRIVLADEPGSVANITIGPGSVWNESVQSVVLAGRGAANINLLPGSALNFQSNLVINPEGSVTGSGTITGGVFNVGTVRVGNSPGELTIVGDYRQLPAQNDPDPTRANRSGALEMEIAGTSPGQYDRLIVTGNVDLGGGLVVNLAPGVEIPESGTLEIVSGARGNSRFDVALLPTLGLDRFARVVYGDTDDPIAIGVQPIQAPFSPGTPTGAPLAGTPSAVVVADFNADGSPDLAIAVPAASPTATGSVFVFRNAGVVGGQWQGFQSVLQLNTGVDPSDIDAADLDGDDQIDLVVSNRGSDTVSTYRNAANGSSFITQTPIAVGDNPSSVSASVLYNDGGINLPDLIVSNEGSGTILLLRSNDAVGGPSIVPQQTITVPGRPKRTRPSDMDDDKRNEAVTLIASDGNPSSLNAVIPIVRVSPSLFGLLPPVPVADDPQDLVVANISAVPTPDIAVVCASGVVSVLRNQLSPNQPIGSQPFAPAVNLPVQGSALDVAAYDIDADGDNDLAVVLSQGVRDVYTLRNVTDDATTISLASPQALDTGSNPLLVTGGDVDGSGVFDVIHLGPPPPGRCPECLGGDNLFVLPAVGQGCDTIDFNRNDIFPEDQDLLDFLDVLAGGECSTCSDIDFNNNGIFPEDQDVLDFLNVLAGGTCP